MTIQMKCDDSLSYSFIRFENIMFLFVNVVVLRHKIVPYYVAIQVLRNYFQVNLQVYNIRTQR